MEFVSRVRRFTEEGEPYPIGKAVKECIRIGILEEYLQERGSEVENMLIAEYNYEEDMEVKQEEAFEEGLQVGRQQGLQQGMQQGVHLTKKVLQLSAQNTSPEMIAKLCEISVEKVREILED